MKVLDKYVLKSFLKPFIATFLIILFILVMQVIWSAFDYFAGKGITTLIILKFFWYSILALMPQAIPIGVLLSSIMCLGNLSENYEFAAAKSSGISLQRLIRPLIITTFILSLVNFVFLNDIFPYAKLKQLNLKANIKSKQPVLALVSGSFNSEIPNYHIKFDKKYGKKKNLLKNVIIYDLTDNKGNNKIITAKKGKIVSEKGSRYMTVVLTDGNFFNDNSSNRGNNKRDEKKPASFTVFDEHTINLDMSKFLEGDLSAENYTKHHTMLNLQQLKDTIPQLKINYDEFIKNKAENLALDIEANKLFKKDSIVKTLEPKIIDNFEDRLTVAIYRKAAERARRRLQNYFIESYSKKRFQNEREKLNLYDIQFYNRIALSFSCLLLFFIGAPLGSIIKKGGMGLPMIAAIIIYVTYFFSDTFGKNMAEESTFTAFTGSWAATALMLPLAIILTRRATKDKGLIVQSILYKFKNLIKKTTQILNKS